MKNLLKYASLTLLWLLPGAVSAVCPTFGSAPTCQDCRIGLTWSGQEIVSATLTGRPTLGGDDSGWVLYVAVLPKASVGGFNKTGIFQSSTMTTGEGPSVRIDLTGAASALKSNTEAYLHVTFAKGGERCAKTFKVLYQLTPDRR